MTAWLGFDPRSLGLFRIGLGAACVVGSLPLSSAWDGLRLLAGALLIPGVWSRAALLVLVGALAAERDFAWAAVAALALALPVARRFSVDALLHSLRARREVVASQLAELPPLETAIVGAPVRPLWIVLAGVVHGWWYPAPLPWVLAGCALLVIPAALTRRLGLAVLVGLDVKAAITMGILPFPAVVPIALLAADDWRLLARLAIAAPRTVYFDASCGICFQTARLFARLDGARRLTWRSNAEGELPAGVTPELVERTIVVTCPRGTLTTRHEAFAEILSAIPWARPLAWLLLVPGLSSLAGLAYDAVARNRRRLSVFFGLAACGLPAPRTAGSASRPPRPAWLRALRVSHVE